MTATLADYTPITGHGALQFCIPTQSDLPPGFFTTQRVATSTKTLVNHPATGVATTPERQARGVWYHGDGSDEKGAYGSAPKLPAMSSVWATVATVVVVVLDVHVLSTFRTYACDAMERCKSAGETTMENTKRQPATRGPRDRSA
ncbi:hypothetical protein KM043_013561 [Ampulex compressa]|nr:hypothetical protein KM043_013561 [Ampulex compressa]